MIPYKKNLLYSATTMVVVTLMYVQLNTDAILVKAIIRTVAFTGGGVAIVLLMMFMHGRFSIGFAEFLLMLMYASVAITVIGLIAIVVRPHGYMTDMTWNAILIAMSLRTGFLIPMAMFSRRE